MHTVITDRHPYDEVLFSEGDITITSSRIEIESNSHAMKYLSTVALSAQHPPRTEAKIALVASLLALFALMVYLVVGKVTPYAFFFMGLLAIGGAIGSAVVLWVNPSNYVLNLKMINGETIQLASHSESYIHRVHAALTTGIALNRQDPMVREPPRILQVG